MRPTKLKAEYNAGAGFEIYGDMPTSTPCVEYTMKPGWQTICQPYSTIMGFAPWKQFPPKEWDEMLGTIFQEMVDAWNEKYATKEKL